MASWLYTDARIDSRYHVQVKLLRMVIGQTPSEVPLHGIVVRVFRGGENLKVGRTGPEPDSFAEIPHDWAGGRGKSTEKFGAHERDIGPSPLTVAWFRAERSLMELSADVDYLVCFNVNDHLDVSSKEGLPVSIQVNLKDDVSMEGKEHLLLSAKKFLIKEFEKQNLPVNRLRFTKVTLEYSEKFG
jgi:hypothetical protein